MESLAMEIQHDYQTEPLSQQPKRSPRTDNAPDPSPDSLWGSCHSVIRQRADQVGLH